jgi:hypothetical protein
MAKTATNIFGTRLTTIRSVADVSRIVRNSNESRLLFRGQNVDRPLLPRLARIANDKGIPYQELVKIERRMLQRLIRESPHLVRGNQIRTDWEWLSVAQHQGLPTRLLDWTASALAGLWFAVAVDPQDGADGVLWVLELSAKNERTPSADDDVFSSPRTFVFQPFHLDQRIVAQSGWFSAHRYAEAQGKFVPLERIGTFKNSLTRYTIGANQFGPLRNELRSMGITQATLFPDLSGLCAEIQAECLGSLRPLRTI